MNTRNTWLLVLVAAGCFAALWLADNRFRNGAAPGRNIRPLFPQMIPGQVDSLDVAGTNLLVRAKRVNGRWMLSTPSYPAQSSPIDALLQGFSEAGELDRISAKEIGSQRGGLKAFGLEPPSLELSVGSGSSRFDLRIGSPAPFAGQIYVQQSGSADVIVTEAALLKLVPTQASDWRDRSLFAGGIREFNHLQIRSGVRSLEMEQSTNGNLWRLTKPIPGRADSRKVDSALQELQGLRVESFVADAGAVDFERYGLQPPRTTLTLLSDTNTVAQIDFGSSPTNSPDLVYARIAAFTNVVLIPKAPLEAFQPVYKGWHDPRVLDFNAASVSRIIVEGVEKFTIQRTPAGSWVTEGASPMVCDPVFVAFFLANLGRLEITDFARELPSESDLRTAGLLPPRALITLQGRTTNVTGVATNIVLSELHFGTNTTDTIFVRRMDEAPIYATPLSGLAGIPAHAYEIRERRLWNFGSTNVVSISVMAGGKTTEVKRNAAGAWSDDSVLAAAIEEVTHRVGQVEALTWLSRGEKGMSAFGFSSASPTLTLNLRQAGVDSSVILVFGRKGPRNNPFAATFLPGEKELTIFEFPGPLHEQLLRFLPFGG